MSENVVIAVDALGGDNAPGVVVEGVLRALESDANLCVLLCGPKEVVLDAAQKNSRCIPKVTTEAISMAEHPAMAVRKKKDSSLVVGCKCVADGQAQGFFSAGSTGACLAAATLKIGRIKGISRPMLATIVPSPVAPVLLCDVGANADCKPEYLVQFARMATIFMERIIGKANPRVALLNIGAEETKGSAFAQECYRLMKENVANFAGNAEGGDILPGNFDIFVTDGFTGNVCLKTIEGTAKSLFKSLKGIMKASPLTMLGALTMKGKLTDLAASISPDTYGGAPLLGVKGACIVGHGSSGPEAICNGILSTRDIVTQNLCGLIAEAVEAGIAETAQGEGGENSVIE